MGAGSNDIHPLLDQHGWHRVTTWRDHIGEGKLTPADAQRIQAIADEFQTRIYVDGSRAEGGGRGGYTTLPVGKGRGTRSDIDFRFDVLHQRAEDIKAALNRVGEPGQNGKFPGNARDKHNINDPADPLRWSCLDFHPTRRTPGPRPTRPARSRGAPGPVGCRATEHRSRADTTLHAIRLRGGGPQRGREVRQPRPCRGQIPCGQLPVR